ncbi:predicted protein [Plenodomus lingam JN3]|uniref:Uncharacterized protein n=1 Tax=Leptosphaeria maculans (strain JN3 / isolate v23.1.3 / race Av1-4-5-6-7-8) TaxID=985895 RepID=E4ZGQ5_LEPMJ|nr:predicted protein [Plenodomus lingam JN3]CBX90475.1 predicted protein [Plenodomus lingam JN3]
MCAGRKSACTPSKDQGTYKRGGVKVRGQVESCGIEGFKRTRGCGQGGWSAGSEIVRVCFVLG